MQQVIVSTELSGTLSMFYFSGNTSNFLLLFKYKFINLKLEKPLKIQLFLDKNDVTWMTSQCFIKLRFIKIFNS